MSFFQLSAGWTRRTTNRTRSSISVTFQRRVIFIPRSSPELKFNSVMALFNTFYFLLFFCSTTFFSLRLVPLDSSNTELIGNEMYENIKLFHTQITLINLSQNTLKCNSLEKFGAQRECHCHCLHSPHRMLHPCSTIKFVVWWYSLYG